jgi:hypothetical protein
LLRCSPDQVLPDPRVPLHPRLLHKEVDRLRVLILRYSAGWVTLARLHSHGVGCFIKPEGTPSVRTNIYDQPIH